MAKERTNGLPTQFSDSWRRPLDYVRYALPLCTRGFMVAGQSPGLVRKPSITASSPDKTWERVRSTCFLRERTSPG